MKYYTQEHYWIDTTTLQLGLTHHLIQEIGQIRFIELPQIGETFHKDQVWMILESSKAAMELYAPFECHIVSIHTALQENTTLLNQDPQVWLVTISTNYPIEKLWNEKQYLSYLRIPLDNDPTT